MSDVDAAKLPVMLNALRLPTIGRIWQEFGARADREGWGSARFLAAMCKYPGTVPPRAKTPPDRWRRFTACSGVR
ncbi:MAG: hypothetical protein HYR63_25810 [Proteobacteria bacterium]|nr:hypothetical protein [Pseudomonadota bacterium]MBI3497346.1 hypothetical protein [Pseudomonadota bacterium]